jgi:hypothetical protein
MHLLGGHHNSDCSRNKLILGLKVVYPLTDEPWGVRRFFVTDPNGLVINVMSHQNDAGLTKRAVAPMRVVNRGLGVVFRFSFLLCRFLPRLGLLPQEAASR